MKIECPYCYQHYEIEKSDMDRELVCINCEQSFRVRDALVLEQTPAHRQSLTWLLAGMGVLIVLLLGLNLWNWQRLVELRAASAHAGPATFVKQDVVSKSAEDLQTVIAPLYRTLKEMRAENERLTKQAATLEKTVAELKTRLDKAEKQTASVAGADRVASLEEGVNTQAIKIEGVAAQIKLLDEYHKQLLKGLTDLRSEIQVLNLNDRLNTLEKKVDSVDLDPINRRIDKLDAILNAMRTVR